MNEMLFRQLERMLIDSKYGSGCYNPKELEKRVLNLTNDQLFEATQMMYSKKGSKYAPEFNYPNITFTFLMKGDINSPIFMSIKHKVIFWEEFVNMKPDYREELTFLEALLIRNSDLEESEVNAIVMIAKCSRGSVLFSEKLDKIIGQFGKQADNTVIIGEGANSIHSCELFDYCLEQTEEAIRQETGFCLNMKTMKDISRFKFTVLKHKSFEKIMYSLVYNLFSSDCIYQGFLDDVVLSISTRLEKLGFNYDFLEDIIKDRFEIYGELDMDNLFERELTLDIIALEKIVNIKPYPYYSIVSWMKERAALLFRCLVNLFVTKS